MSGVDDTNNKLNELLLKTYEVSLNIKMNQEICYGGRPDKNLLIHCYSKETPNKKYKYEVKILILMNDYVPSAPPFIKVQFENIFLNIIILLHLLLLRAQLRLKYKDICQSC